MTLKEAIPEVAAPSRPHTRVSKAARWLDENHPDWYKRVNPKTLNMGSGASCVAGQVTNNPNAYAGFAIQSNDYMSFGSDESLVSPWTTEIEYRLALDIVNS